MKQIMTTASNDQWELGYFTQDSTQTETKPVYSLPPAVPGLQVFGLGTAGAKVVQLVVRYWLERVRQGLSAAYIDYPVPQIASIPWHVNPRKIDQVPAEPFCPVGEQGDRRDRARQFELLRKRYSQEVILRGIPVYEDRKLGVSGEGGGAIPSVAALDIDLNIQRHTEFMREQLQWMNGIARRNETQSDLEVIIKERAKLEQRNNRLWNIFMVGGGAGATGNALLQIHPYLVRRILREMGISNYRLIGIILGPSAFMGLTPFVDTNYRALLYSLDYMAHHGLRHEFINGTQVDMEAPPYDHVLLVDDNTLETDEAGSVTETGLDIFYNRAARAIGVMLSSNAWDVVSARTVNPDASVPNDGRLRWFTTISVATAGVDKDALLERAIALKQAQLLKGLAGRLSAVTQAQA